MEKFESRWRCFFFSRVSLVQYTRADQRRKKWPINEVHRFIECVKSLEMQSNRNIIIFFSLLCSFRNFALFVCILCTCVLRHSEVESENSSYFHKITIQLGEKANATKYDNIRVFTAHIYVFC